MHEAHDRTSEADLRTWLQQKKINGSCNVENSGNGTISRNRGGKKKIIWLNNPDIFKLDSFLNQPKANKTDSRFLIVKLNFISLAPF